jgi:hypothetical protein
MSVLYACSARWQASHCVVCIVRYFAFVPFSDGVRWWKLNIAPRCWSWTPDVTLRTNQNKPRSDPLWYLFTALWTKRGWEQLRETRTTSVSMQTELLKMYEVFKHLDKHSREYNRHSTSLLSRASGESPVSITTERSRGNFTALSYIRLTKWRFHSWRNPKHVNFVPHLLPFSSETSLVWTYLLTYGAEPFLRSCQLCSHSRPSQDFMEPEGSSPCSQDPSTGPCPESDRSSPHHTIPSYLSKIYFNIAHPPTSWSS